MFLLKLKKSQLQLKHWLNERRLYRLEEARNSLHLSTGHRFALSILPFSCFLLVILQLYLSGDVSRLIEIAGVVEIRGVAWDISSVRDVAGLEECYSASCFRDQEAMEHREAVHLPNGDPLALRSWPIKEKSWYLYKAVLPHYSDLYPQKPMLYLPGIRAQHVRIFANDVMIINSSGGTPYFVALPRQSGSRVVNILIAVAVTPQASFQGFINGSLLVGDTLGIYRAHHNLEFRTFPRYAAVVYLLAIAAITLVFFIFLDHQRELLALSVALSLLGIAQAVKVGILPGLGTETYIVVNAYFYTFLIWYGMEHMRINRSLPVLLLALPIPFLVLRFAAVSWFDQTMAATIKQFVFDFFAAVPIVLGVVALGVATFIRQSSRVRSTAIGISGVFFLVYGCYVIGVDRFSGSWISFDKMYEIPTIVCASAWAIAALSSLGSLEERVAKSAEDTRQRTVLEQELALAQEVQETFIHAGLQPSHNFEVIAVYKAARRVGGDWLTWRELANGYSLAIIGDVVGKGVQAGLIVSACDAALSLVLAQPDFMAQGPDNAIRQIVQGLVQGVFRGKPQRAMTAVIMIMSQDNEVVFATLGHLPLVNIGPRGATLHATRNEWINEQTKIANLQSQNFKVEEDELLLAFTDGLCETSRELKRLVKLWLPYYLQPLEDVARTFDDIRPEKDDVSIMLMRQKKVA